jgi:hypothetical protein
MEQRITNKMDAMFEDLTGYVGVIESDHAYVHSGIAYSVSLDSGSLEAAGSKKFLLTTPAAETAYIHFRPIAASSTANFARITFCETPTEVTGGDAVTTVVNRNRNSSRTTGVVMKSGITAATDGTVLGQLTVGSGGVQGRSGGSGSYSGAEIVLKPATNYCITVANIGETTATTVYFELFWYEEAQG